MNRFGHLSGFAKIIPYVIIALLIVAAYYIFLYDSLESERQELSREISSLRQETRELEQDLDDIAALEAEIEYMENELSNLLELQLYDKQEARKNLEDMVEEAELRVRNQVSREADEGYLYTLSLTGIYQSFYDFLNLLDEADFRYQVEDFHLTPQEDNLHMLINVNFYQWDVLEHFSEMDTGR